MHKVKYIVIQKKQYIELQSLLKCFKTVINQDIRFFKKIFFMENFMPLND